VVEESRRLKADDASPRCAITNNRTQTANAGAVTVVMESPTAAGSRYKYSVDKATRVGPHPRPNNILPRDTRALPRPRSSFGKLTWMAMKHMSEHVDEAIMTFCVTRAFCGRMRRPRSSCSARSAHRTSYADETQIDSVRRGYHGFKRGEASRHRQPPAQGPYGREGRKIAIRLFKSPILNTRIAERPYFPWGHLRCRMRARNQGRSGPISRITFPTSLPLSTYCNRRGESVRTTQATASCVSTGAVASKDVRECARSVYDATGARTHRRRLPTNFRIAAPIWCGESS
jgi:hypothetical protein